MKSHYRLGDLQEKIESLGLDNLHDSLEIITDTYSIKNCVYLALQSQKTNFESPFIMHTHTPEWEQRYQEQAYQKIDPVLSYGLRSLLPLDWTNLKQVSNSAAMFFQDAEQYGVGNQGLTIPIRGCKGELALFSISTEETSGHWTQFRQEMIAEMTMIAFYLHHQAITLHEPEIGDIILGPRQREVLQWAANGKTAHDIASILNISFYTVRTHMESARTKLNALNMTHAVARAIALNLINKPD